jgi:hypothetical protein
VLLNCCQNDKTPPITISSDLNWGTVSANDTVFIDIICNNIGKKDIIIDNIKTRCSCIVIFPTHFIIRSKESTTINVKFVPNSIGYMEEDFFLIARNYSTPYCITIKGKVKKD